MTSLVPYASSSEDEDSREALRGKSKGSKRKLQAFSDQEETRRNSSKVHTSLGLASTKPIKGDWLCHVYVAVDQDERMGRLIDECLDLLKDIDRHIERVSQPHISLTKPILIRYHEREDFIFKTNIAAQKDSSPSRLGIAFSGFTSLPSEDDSRVYYTLEVGLGWQELRTLTSKLNQELATLHARNYFKEARYHCSFASSTRVEDDVKVSHLCDVLERKLGNRLRASPVLVTNELCVATGSQVSIIKLC